MTTRHQAFGTADVAAAFAAFPPETRGTLLDLRDLVFDTAGSTRGVGPLTETLKWGQPAYLTAETKAGTTIRLGMNARQRPAVFVHCRTRVICSISDVFPDAFDYAGTREAALRPGPVPVEALRHLFAAALTYQMK